MALAGGGGAGNTAGSNPSGTGTIINFLRYDEKTLVYAYSGAITVTGDDQVVIDHTTSNESIDAKIMPQYLDDAVDGDDVLMKIILNGQQIGGAVCATDFGATNNLGPENWIPIVIPPYSRFQVTFSMLSGGGSIELGISLTGEAYA